MTEEVEEGLEVCRCCLSSGYFNSLWQEFIIDDKKMVFGDMLSECFAIQLSKNGSVNMRDQICEDCITSLLEADNFKKKVLSSQEHYYNLPIFYDKSEELNQMPKLRVYDDTHKTILDAEAMEIAEVKAEAIEQFVEEEYLEDDCTMEDFLNFEMFTDSEVPIKNEVSINDDMGIQPEEPIFEGRPVLKKINHTPFKAKNLKRKLPELENVASPTAIKIKDFEVPVNTEVSIIDDVETTPPRDPLSNRRQRKVSKAIKNTPFKPLLKRKLLELENIASSTEIKIKEGAETISTFLKNNEKNIQQCIDAVAKGRLNVSQACRMYNCTRNVVSHRIAKLRPGYTPRRRPPKVKTKVQSTIKRMKNSDLTIEELAVVQNLPLDQSKRRRPVKAKIQSTIKQMRNSDLTIEEGAAAHNLPLDEFTELLKTRYPKDYKHIRYLEKVTKGFDAKAFDESQTQVADDQDNDIRIIKVIRKHSKPSKETLTNAIEAIKNGMTYTSANRMFNVTKTILERFVKTNLEVTDLNIDIVMHQKKNKKHSIEFIKHCANLVRDGKISKAQAKEWFQISRSNIDTALKQARTSDEQNSAKHSIKRNGIHVVEVARFNLEQRMTLEKNVQTILNYTNATPFIIYKAKILCAYCIKNFEKPDELRNHIITAHSEERLTKVPDMLRPPMRKEIMRLDLHELKCTQCDKDLKKIDDMYKHLETKHNYIVEESEKKFIVPFVLQYFKAVCTICDKRFGDYVKLEQHMSKHFNNHVCHECGESFIMLERLKAHNITERRSKGQFKCPHCEEVVVGGSKYHDHLVKNHNFGPRPCHYCTERFRTRYTHHMHMLKKHRDKVKDIVCECGKVYNWRPFYLQHFRIVHLGQRNYSCCYCDKKFFSNSDVRKHMITHVGQQAFICTVCHVKCPKAVALSEHWKSHK